MATLTVEQFEKKLRRFGNNHPDLLKVALRRGAETVRLETVRKHLSGPKMPKGIGSTKNATLARRSGDLAGSLNTRVVANNKRQSAKISTSLIYARIHEKGDKSKGMPKRPYLEPSLQAKRKEIVDDILKAMIRGYKKA